MILRPTEDRQNTYSGLSSIYFEVSILTNWLMVFERVIFYKISLKLSYKQLNMLLTKNNQDKYHLRFINKLKKKIVCQLYQLAKKANRKKEIGKKNNIS
jgi:hypothetical protein